MSILLALALTPLMLLWSGFVFHRLWEWLAVPALALPQLSYGQSVGIVVLLAWLLSRSDAHDGEDGFEVVGKRTTFALLNGAFSLLVGWIVHVVVYA